MAATDTQSVAMPDTGLASALSNRLDETRNALSAALNGPALAGAAVSVIVALALPESLAVEARIAILVTLLCITGWTLTKLPDSLVAVAGALALVATGVIAEKHLYAALGSELVWLLIAAFVIAAILKASGVMEPVALTLMRPFRTVTGLFTGLTLFIAATAFIIPSTSGRAALLLPVFLSLAGALPDARLRRPLGLLFPSVILLSAGGSLIGAGAHLIAVDAMVRAGHAPIGFAGWIALALPFALLTSLAAMALILRIFVPADLRHAALNAEQPRPAPLSTQQKRLLGALPLIIALWISEPVHGFGVAIVALAAAMVLMTPVFSRAKPKDVFKGIEMELILFLTATVVVAEALSESGADRWLAQGALSLLPAGLSQALPAVAAFTAVVAVLSHLFITSRSARAAVLIPALALPVAAFGHDVRLIVLVTVLGTGFCQTMMASAKPVAIFGNAEPAPFRQADLTRLAAPLMPVTMALLIIFAIAVWPRQLGTPADTARQPAIPMTAERTVPLVETAMPGALCARDDLRLVMLAQISERRMWASGWWRVWDRLQKAGMPVEQEAIKAIYRADDMVLLRRSSTVLASALADPARVAQARAKCGLGEAG